VPPGARKTENPAAGSRLSGVAEIRDKPSSCLYDEGCLRNGAQLVVAEDADIPDEFTLQPRKPASASRKCRVAWRKRTDRRRVHHRVSLEGLPFLGSRSVTTVSGSPSLRRRRRKPARRCHSTLCGRYRRDRCRRRRPFLHGVAPEGLGEFLVQDHLDEGRDPSFWPAQAVSRATLSSPACVP